MKIILLIMTTLSFAEVDITFEVNGKKNMPFYSSLSENAIQIKTQEKKILEKKYLSIRDEIEKFKDTLNYFDKKFIEKKVNKKRMIQEYSFALKLINKRIKKINEINQDFEKNMGESIFDSTELNIPNTDSVKEKLLALKNLKEEKKIQKPKKVKFTKKAKNINKNIIKEQIQAFEQSKTMTLKELRIAKKIKSFKIQSNTIFSKINLSKNKFKFPKKEKKKKVLLANDYFKTLNSFIKKEKKSNIVKKEVKEITKPLNKQELPKKEIPLPKKENQKIKEYEWNNDVIRAKPSF